MTIIDSNARMEQEYASLAKEMIKLAPFDRGEVHAQKITKPEMHTRELLHVSQRFQIPVTKFDLQSIVKPNLPWAEDHFQERVSGKPLNPPPSNDWWPFAQAGNAEHKDEMGSFSHTYPERFWPKVAGVSEAHINQVRVFDINVGIRFEYGDLGDLIDILNKNPRSRQAYLPVWFPEDLQAATQGERVPCTLGYHFLLMPDGTLDCTYYMRSCDMIRFYRDDVYMAGRLLQYVCNAVNARPGRLILHIANLHTFMGDTAFLQRVVHDYSPRKHYDFGSMF